MPLYNESDQVNTNLVGRVAALKFETKRGRVLLQKNEMIGRDSLSEIVEAFKDEQGVVVPVRSVLKCEAEAGVCQSCYGMSLATGSICDMGDAAGSSPHSRSVSPAPS